MNLKPWHILSSYNEELRERALSEPLRARKSWRYRIVGDLFASLSFESIAAVLGVVAASSRHEFEVVTLCPERAGEFYRWAKYAYGEDRMFPAEGCRHEALFRIPGLRGLEGQWTKGAESLLGYDQRWPLPNLRLTTHVTTQAEADARIIALNQCPAASYGLTVTLAEDIDIRPWLSDNDGCEECDDSGIGGPGHCRRSDIPRCEQCPTKFAVFENDERGTRKTLALVTVKGATDPVHPDWVRSIRDQCTAAGVPFRFDGWGTCCPEGQVPPGVSTYKAFLRRPFGPNGPMMVQLGNKSGRLLDGVTHDEEQP